MENIKKSHYSSKYSQKRKKKTTFKLKNKKKQKKSSVEEMIYVQKYPSKQMKDESPKKCRERTNTITSVLTQESSKQILPDVEALRKMVDLAEKFKEKTKFEDVLNSPIGSSLSGISDEDTKKKSIDASSKNVLVVDMELIRKKLQFESEEREDLIDDEEDICQFIQDNLEIQSQSDDILETNHFSQDSETDDFWDGEFVLDTHSNNSLQSDEDNIFTNIKYNFKESLNMPLSYSSDINTSFDSETETEETEINKNILNEYLEDAINEFEISTLIDEEILIEKKINKLNETLQNEQKTIKELQNHLTDFMIKEDKEKQEIEKLIKMKHYQKNMSFKNNQKYYHKNKKSHKRKSMLKIDSLFAPKSLGVRPTPKLPDLMTLSKPETKKSFKKTIFFTKCKYLWNNGFCPKGDRCGYLHLNSGQEYTDLLSSFSNLICKNVNRNKVTHLLESVDQMHSGLPIFKKFVYRKNEGCIFESLLGESSSS